jgi:hypothetical protein
LEQQAFAASFEKIKKEEDEKDFSFLSVGIPGAEQRQHQRNEEEIECIARQERNSDRPDLCRLR